MDIEFLKLQSCGNDYLVVDTFKNTILNSRVIPDMAGQITSRRFGVGAVGLLLIVQGAQGGDFAAGCMPALWGD